MSQFRPYAQSIISYISSPVMLVSLFGPMIQRINLVLIEQRINFDTGKNFVDLKNLLDNLTTHGLLSYNTQIFVLLLAWILVYTEAARIVFPRVFSEKRDNSNLTWLLLVILAIMFFLGLVAFLSGFFASPSLIKLYEPVNLSVVGDLTFPPFSSRITICRGILILYSLFFSYWQMKVLPKKTAIKNEHNS